MSTGLCASTLLDAHQHETTRSGVSGPLILDPVSLTPFVDPLPIPPIAQSIGLRPSPANPRIRLPYFRIPIQQMEAKVHRDLEPTRFWTYGHSVPGPTFEVRSGEGVLVEWPNGLPSRHFLPIDHTLMGAEPDQPQVRTVVHLHGGKVPSASDGHPESWYVPGQSALNYYPNQQDAALLWYHDHAMGINRLNIYAGMIGLYIVRDRTEDALNLPRGKYELPLVLCDRAFTQAGQLFYPISTNPDSPWVPEAFGNTTLINGKLLPYIEVEPQSYRLRLLNGSNSRFYYLNLEGGQGIFQIGSDQGLLAAPVSLTSLALAPGERADVIVHFRERAGENVILRNGMFPLLQFHVARGPENGAYAMPRFLRSVPKLKESSAVKTRLLTIRELDHPMIHLLNDKRWHEPVTETPVIDTVEIWSLINLADDPHPIHLHLVRFQILDRQSFSETEYLNTGNLRYLGPPVPPSPGEAGWKDTVRADPKMVTRIIARFEGYTGRYVWHCHILEHEDNEMMRPFEVMPSAG